jgi:hypothetical protein
MNNNLNFTTVLKLKNMKKLLLSTLLLSFYGVAQNAPHESYQGHTTNTKFFKTAPIQKYLNQSEDFDVQQLINATIKDGKKTNSVGLVDRGIPENNGIDPAIQTAPPIYKGQTKALISFNGLSGGGPPDPSGAAGPEHYVQAKNSSYKIYRKDGTSSGAWSHSLSYLWPGSTNDGDPIVMYDRYAERWFISQFQTDTDEILIAISETSDPTGAYFAYTFSVPVSGASFPDYPKFGIWPNGYYMSANCSVNNCVVFEREKMLLGDPDAGMIRMNFPTSIRYFFRSFAPAYAEGATEPDADEPYYYFHVQDDSWNGVNDDHLKVIKCEVDWTDPSASSVTVSQEIETQALNTAFTASWDDISQQGTTQNLDAVPSILMYKVQYRRFDDYNTAVMCTTVDLNNGNRAGIRWFELRDSNDGEWFIHQEGTYAPDNTNNRWMGSISMDCLGNMALAYSFAGPNDYAGIRYTGRFKDDPINQMTVEEQIGVEGLGSQTGFNRYGDYSQMTMDPTDDLTFWFTGEYLGTNGSVKTRIISFSSWHLLGQTENENKQPFFNAFQPNPNSIKLIWNSLEDTDVRVELFDMNGRLIFTEAINGNETERFFDIPTFAKGIYLIKLSGKNTNLTKKLYLS